jgi:nicotinamide-nucleotide amidase
VKKAEILAIGDELLSGETVDTNSSYLDGVLEKWGWTVVRHTTVADELDDIAAAFREAAARADLVVSTGGLGPTQDDLTLEGLARAQGCELVEHAETLERIERLFAAMGREMTPNNRRQAMVPAKGQVVANDSGTAPAFFAEFMRAKIFLMPGVPREVRHLVEHRLLDAVGRGDREILRRTIKVIGIGESKLEDMIKEVVAAHRSVRFGYRTQGIENHVKLLAEGSDRAALIEAAAGDLRRVLTDRIFGEDADTLEDVVGRTLRARGAKVATAESCTGGWIAKLLTDVAGSSDYVLGGVVSYSNEAKVSLLGVRSEDLLEHGAVSEPVAKSMAAGARDRFGADYGIGVTGVAGPTGGTDLKPVGTVWIAVASSEGVESQLLKLPVRSREWIREMSARAALGLLHRKVLGSDRKSTATS